jgi:hypothetical protein
MRAKPWSIMQALALTALLATVPVTAQPREEPGRACTRTDLVGTWDMQGMSVDRSETIDPANTWYFKVQRFMFGEDGTVRHLASNKPLQASDLKALASVPATSRWRVDERGYLSIQPPGNAKSPEALCALLTGDMPGPTAPRRGDILLSYMRDGRPYVQKLLRKTQ